MALLVDDHQAHCSWMVSVISEDVQVDTNELNGDFTANGDIIQWVTLHRWQLGLDEINCGGNLSVLGICMLLIQAQS